ncbi:caspase family protein [Streptomyces sp. NPDC005897]|uniref:caspase family protein n=1 Tax=Streptomyces sp. NPDC005897 TaxID=3157081 RepID=UPI0033C44E48
MRPGGSSNRWPVNPAAPESRTTPTVPEGTLASPPDPSASRAVLIGAGSYETLDGLTAVADSAEGLARLFTQQDIWGLPPAHCRVVLNPQSPRQLSKPVAEAAQNATDTLVVYYAGHGLIEPRTGELHLAVGDSDWMSVHDTAAPYDWIRRSIEQSPAARKIAVIDCCYSARAFGVQSANASAALEVEGTYVLTASAENAVAIAPPGEQYTAFIGELIKFISNGSPEGSEFIDLDTVYTKLRLELGLRGRPEPHRLCRNSLGTAPFIRNVAFEPLPTASRRSWRLGRPAMRAAPLHRQMLHSPSPTSVLPRCGACSTS